MKFLYLDTLGYDWPLFTKKSPQAAAEAVVAYARLVALDKAGFVTIAPKQFFQFVVADAGQHSRAGDLVAIQMQDRQHGAVENRIEKLVRVPTSGRRAGLRLAVADDTDRQQFRVVEDGAIRVG